MYNAVQLWSLTPGQGRRAVFFYYYYFRTLTTLSPVHSFSSFVYD